MTHHVMMVMRKVVSSLCQARARGILSNRGLVGSALRKQALVIVHEKKDRS